MVAKVRKVKTKKVFSQTGNTNICKIYVRLVFSNIFCTMTDMRDRVVICCSAGSSGVTGTKRRKIAPQALQYIMRKMYPYMSKYGVRKVELVLVNRVSKIAYHLAKEIAHYGLLVSFVTEKLVLAHNGVRPRKLRRN